MKDLGPLHHFLGISMEQRPNDLFLQQHQYTLYTVERTGMTNCKPCAMLVDSQAKVSFEADAPISDPTVY
jgi:hypothetical protein